jgi:hypothetical protein
MKTLRSLLALAFALALTGSAAFADRPADRKVKGRATPGAVCGCVTGKDGKACGVDKDCCCTGEKAKGRPEEKKSAEAKPAAGDACCGACGA